MIAVQEDFGRLLAMLRLFGKTKSPFLPFRGQALAIAKMLAAPHTDSSTAYVKAVPAGRRHAEILNVGGATIVDSGALASAIVTSIVSKDADGVTLDSYAIPADVQTLTGYGLSAGTAYNYVDFERKVFVQNVESFNMGTMSNWSYNAGSGSWKPRFQTNILANLVKKPGTSTDVANVLTAPYSAASDYAVGRDASTDKAIAISPGGIVYVRDSAYTDVDAFKAAVSGVMLHVELATPVETDISAYLADATLDVSGGGTLTFVNANQIPVPSTVVFTI